ncbi:uncharacterized protein PHACADRAFT_251416 [Phanerochaete carnosa HHB-10118-sp]|uniref:Uncharacterized protein n=1 Tax=Phanerochaete carnosa (strain HHB-10118-sp) TaxID=650164 RepID=K5WEC4_PHACS|nr:uncharacterized protein PHACADRAFT_251416 [Phanerochaete carnosa HHB-10118-sp]EKM57655.1 hypothetical protein PHACADRAFT_251416 [Phanerochaete carnosa HHB-10118-sp]
MSSPIAIPRTASSSSLSSSGSHSGVYVPVHKRRDINASPASPTSRSISPTPSGTSESWREHKPSKAPTAAFRSKRQHRKTPSNASVPDHPHDNNNGSNSIADIPKQSTIPKRTPLPNTYSIHTLLSLSSAPAELAPEKLASLRDLTTYTVTAQADKPAQRRRRTGRQGKKTPQLPAVVLQTADVEVRRKRNGHGHGAWGWHTYTSVEAVQTHQHDLETDWRHAPHAVFGVIA